MVASISPTDTKPKIIARDGHYIKYANGIVKDIVTQLEWYAGPDEGMTVNEANRWVASLNVNGGGWRMPTRSELGGLYQKGAGSRNMTSLLKTSGGWVWSGETKVTPSAWGFDFSDGDNYWNHSTNRASRRGFAVRSR